MARKNTSIITDEEFEAGASQAHSTSSRFDDIPLDGRLLELDDEAESPFLRGQKRVPVRRGTLPRKALDRVKTLLVLLLLAGSTFLIAITLYRYATQSWRFRLDSSDDVDIQGTHSLTRAQVLEVFASDIDRNAFFVPLNERKKQLEQIPWIESASVMRLFPNRLVVAVKERTPIAFVELHSHIALIDAQGVVMVHAIGMASMSL